MVKTVLFIANNGEPRIEGLRSFLPQYGWESKWFTMSTEPDFMYEVGHHELDFFRRRMRPIAQAGYRVFREFAEYPRYSANVDLSYWLKDVSAIVASGPPFDAFLIAKSLSAKHHIPWIADYRDLWTQNHNYVYTPFRRVIERRLEKSTIKTARAISTVSVPWVLRLGRISNEKTRWMIPNGFHPNDHRERLMTDKDHQKLKITYAGRIYDKQRPEFLFNVLDRFHFHDPIEVHYYGPTPEKLDGKCGNVQVFVHDPLPHDNMMQVLRSSDILWLMNFPKENGWMSLKIYAYLAARRPIIITDSGKRDCKRKLLEETKAGVACESGIQLRNVLSEWFSCWDTWNMIPYRGVPSMVTLHSQKQTARQMSRVLNRVSE